MRAQITELEGLSRVVEGLLEGAPMTERLTFARAALAALVLAASVGVVGCNTLRGAGQDIEAGGGAIEDAAKTTQQEMNDGNPKTP